VGLGEQRDRFVRIKPSEGRGQGGGGEKIKKWEVPLVSGIHLCGLTGQGRQMKPRGGEEGKVDWGAYT